MPTPRTIDFGWDRIVGHDSTVAALRRATAAEKPHPAYLILGPEGIGKALIARTIAAALVCQAAPEQRPCRQCGACRKVAGATHTDVWAEEPTGRSLTITVDQVSTIQRRLSFRRLEGRHRVVLILGAGTMNEHAQNKLLKTLEEPPAGTVLILTALHRGLMLQTVRSRCQKLALGGVGIAPLAAWLMREHHAAEDAAQSAAAAAGGLPGRAIELLDPDRAAARAARVTVVSDALAGDRAARKDLLKEIDRDREGAREVVSLMQELLRDAVASALGADVQRVHPGSASVDRLAAVGADGLAEIILGAEEVQGRLVRNVHPGGVVQDFLRGVARSA
jgi:DNA polymerase-3 subunit delta'